MGIFNKIASVWTSLGENILKVPISEFNFIETAVNNEDERGNVYGNILIGRDGTLGTVIRVDGISKMMGQEEMDRLIKEGTTSLASFFTRPGHAMQVWFMRDPDLSKDMMENFLKTPRNVARSVGLNLDDVFEEKQRVLPRFMVHEAFYIVLWTRMSVFSRREMESIKLDMKPPALWPTSFDSQDVLRMARQIKTRHDAFVSSFVSNMDRSFGIRMVNIEVHAALSAVRSSIYPEMTTSNWKPNLLGDIGKDLKGAKHIASPRYKDNGLGPNDVSHILPPRLEDQLFPMGAEIINQQVVKVGNRLFYGIDMTLGPLDLMTFNHLLNSLISMQEFPWRVSFLIEGGGLSSVGVKKFLSGVLAITRSDNLLIKKAIEQLEVYQSSGGVITKMRTSFATWGPTDKLNLVEERGSRLQRAVEQWGNCGASPSAGDPLAGVLSSSLGLNIDSTAPTGAVPLEHVIAMLPWMRDASPFSEGSVVFRTMDGRPWLYQPGNSQQTTFIDIIYAPPGRGKSVLLNTTNLAFCLSPLATQGQGGAKLPRIAIIDIGISSSGFISLVKEALPVERRHEAEYRRLRMDKLDSINPFDTQLGCRVPLELDKQFLINFLTLLGTDPNKEAPSALSDLVRMVIDEAYEKFSDKSRQGNPRQYIPGVDENIDKILVKHNISVTQHTTWWYIVDELFKRQDIRYASLAQRYAVPRVEDLPEIANIEQVRNIYGEKKIDDEPLISMFGRIISAALRAYPILTDPTRFDLGEARIVALDLNEAAPQGGPSADKQTALVYMLARFVLARDFYLNKNDLRFFPPEYLRHHEIRVKRIAETPKRLVFDEFHRTKSAQSVRDQVVVDMREGRKWGVHIALSSQLLDDFDKNMRSLATGFWILGCSTEQDKKETSKVFGLTQTAVESLNILNGPLEGGKGSPFLVILEMNDGKHEHLLVNTLGPVELWAFSTTLNDVALRNKLTEILGPIEARGRLAKRFPGGSAKKEIERRQQILVENGQFNADDEAGVVTRLAEEIAGLVTPGR